MASVTGVEWREEREGAKGLERWLGDVGWVSVCSGCFLTWHSRGLWCLPSLAVL